MVVSEFCILVAKMRYAQAKYYKSRTQSNLVDAKALEKQVDDELQGKIILKYDVHGQPVYFNPTITQETFLEKP